jgi:hypothetical protein
MVSRRTAAAVAIMIAIATAGPTTRYISFPGNRCAAATGDSDLKRRLEKLRSVPYTSVTDDVSDRETSGVVLHDPARAWQGYNLYCSRVSPHVYLMDMQGNIVHTWFYSEKRPWNSIHALLMDDGDLILVARLRDTGAVSRIRWDGTREWAINTPAHHDLASMPDGTIYVLVGDIRRYRGLDVEFSALAR